MQHASIQLNKEDRNSCIYCAYDNIIGSNDIDNEIGIVKDTLLEHWYNFIVGGVTIKVCTENYDATDNAKNDQDEEQSSKTPIKIEEKKQTEEETIKPMCSCEKLIPESFYARKYAPKSFNSNNSRNYSSLCAEKFHNDANGSNDYILKEFKNKTKEMLQELMKFQQREKDDNNARSRRRLF